MGKSHGDVRGILRIRLQARQPFNLVEANNEVSIPVDAQDAILEKQLRILRNLVQEVAEELGIDVICDGRRNVIPINTISDVDKAIEYTTKQVAGRGGKLLGFQKVQKSMQSSKTTQPRNSKPAANQITWSEWAALKDPDMAEQVYVPKRGQRMASVVALHARDNLEALRTFMPMLAEDPESQQSFEVACRGFFKKTYGWDVTVPEALLSDGVIQLKDLYDMWLQLAPALRQLQTHSRKPDMKREA